MKLCGDLAASARPAGDCVWEIPPDAKPGMLVPARISRDAAACREPIPRR